MMNKRRKKERKKENIIPDLLFVIFEFLEPKLVCKVLSLVCKEWNNVSSHDYLWKCFYLRMWTNSTIKDIGQVNKERYKERYKERCIGRKKERNLESYIERYIERNRERSKVYKRIYGLMPFRSKIRSWERRSIYIYRNNR